MATNQDPVTRLQKMISAEDYILWKRRLNAYLRRDDAELIGLTDARVSNNASVRKRWLELTTKDKSIIILCLGDSALSKVRRTVDDDNKTAKALWLELSEIYTTSNAQAILNLRNEIDGLKFKNDDGWDAHVIKFTEALGKLATYDAEIPDAEKAPKLTRTLPNSFSALAMIQEVESMLFNLLVTVVRSELARRKNREQNGIFPSPSAKNVDVNRNTRITLGSTTDGKVSKDCKNFGRCYVCGKKGHLASHCWYRVKATGFSGRGRGRCRGGHRGRSGYRFRGRGNSRGLRYSPYPRFGNGRNFYHEHLSLYPPQWPHTSVNNQPPCMGQPGSSGEAPSSMHTNMYWHKQ